MRAWVAFGLALLCACGGPPPPKPAPPPPPAPKPAPPEVPSEDAIVPEEIDFEPKWRGTSFGAYLAPEYDFSKDDDKVDVIFQFHAGQMAGKAWRATRLKAIVVSATFGMGSAPYDHALRNPARFGKWIDEVLAKVAEEKGSRPLHLRRLGVVSFSAGFGAVHRILAQGYADQIDALILLDSIHTSYTADHAPNLHGIASLVDFANLAKERKKVMVITHSSIKPPDYPSCTETTFALLDAIGLARTPLGGRNERGMEQIYRAEAGALHVFGFHGMAAKDHMDHLALVGDMVRTYVARRWARMEALERRAAAP